MLYFLDTEFWDDGSRVWPISIGIVAEDGRELYVECNEGTGMAREAEWIKDNVTPHLSDRSSSLLNWQIAGMVHQFVGTAPAEFWAYWAAYDWVVFCQVMGGLMKLPKNVSPWVRDLAWLDPSLEKIRALKVHNPKPHHALYDARELREQYVRLTAETEAARFTPSADLERADMCGLCGVHSSLHRENPRGSGLCPAENLGVSR